MIMKTASNQTNKAKKKWLIALLVLTVLIGGIAILCVLSKKGPIFELGLVRSETMVLMLAFLLVLPLMLLMMAVLWTVDSRNRKKTGSLPQGSDTPIVITAPVAVKAGDSPADPAEENAPRFCMLSRIDESKRIYDARRYEEEVSLKRFCDNFRNYAAAELRLYYDIKDIRRFIAGMAVSPISILQGMSGTGKTSLAHAMGSFVRNTSTVIPVQPMWKERTDLLGYYNEFTKRFNETLLLEKMYEANYCKDIYITVLDEMNIARVEYYFAEFLSLLEIPNPDKRYLDVVADKWEDDPKLLRDGQIQLPPNMWFVGTANNDDSTFAISDKVYDRAMVINLDRKTQFFEAKPAEQVRISADQFDSMVARAQKEYGMTARSARRLKKLDAYMIDKFKITFGNRIMKQIRQYIPVYLACGGDELDALDDILSKKVFRKLEAQNPIYVRNSVEELCNYLDELFGYDRMKLCKEYLRRFERAA